jgi:hypothetical protein
MKDFIHCLSDFIQEPGTIISTDVLSRLANRSQCTYHRVTDTSSSHSRLLVYLCDGYYLCPSGSPSTGVAILGTGATHDILNE